MTNPCSLKGVAVGASFCQFNFTLAFCKIKNRVMECHAFPSNALKTYLTTVVGWFYFCWGFSVSERGKGSGRAEYLG